MMENLANNHVYNNTGWTPQGRTRGMMRSKVLLGAFHSILLATSTDFLDSLSPTAKGCKHHTLQLQHVRGLSAYKLQKVAKVISPGRKLTINCNVYLSSLQTQ
eukprot:2950147-Amphidinium_carterae.1